MNKLFYAFIVSLLLVSSHALAADPKISDITVEVKKHDDGKQYVVINYSIANIPVDGITVEFDAKCVKHMDTSSSDIFFAKPTVQELSGDVGTITSDGKKSIQWEDEASLSRLNKHDKYRCTAILSLKGSDNTITAASLNIQSYQPSGWTYFNTGLVRMTIEKKGGSLPDFICSQLGGNWADIPYQQGATFYKVTAVTDFPLYLGRNSNDKFKGAVSNTGCSFFLAIRDYGKPTQKLWANFAKRFVQTQDVNGTPITQDYEFQFRYSSTQQSGESLVIGNAGKQGQQIFNELNAGDKFEFKLEAGNLGTAESNSFDIQVPIREWKYIHKGKHVFTLTIPVKQGTFQSTGTGNKLVLTDANEANIGSALNFSGTRLEIDTTPNNSSISFSGQMKANGAPVINTDTGSTVTTLNLNDSLVFSTIAVPLNILARIAGSPVYMERMRLVGDPGAPSTALFDIRVKLRDLNEGCGATIRQTLSSGILLRDVSVDPGGQWHMPTSVHLENIGVLGNPEWCIKNMDVSYDKAGDKLSIDCLVRTPIFSNVGFSSVSINDRLTNAKFGIKASSPICVLPLPGDSPWHFINWTALDLEIDNSVKSQNKLVGSATVGTRADWPTVSDQFGIPSRLANKLNGFGLFELGGKVKVYEVGDIEVDGKLKIFGKDDVWAMNVSGVSNFVANKNTLDIALDGKLTMIELGANNWFFEGAVQGSHSIYPKYDIRFSASGDVTIPDLMKNNPALSIVAKKLKLPARVFKVGVQVKNDILSCDLDFGWMGVWGVWVDLLKNPFTETKDFIGLQSGGSTSLNQITFHVKGNGIQAVDTTYVPFTTKSARFAFAQVSGTGQPQSFLVSPAQKIYNGTTSDSSVIFSPAANSNDVGLWVLRAPADGQWKLGIIGKQNGDSVSIWQLNKPKAEFSYTATNVARNIYCTWENGGANDSATVDFFLDSDSSGFDGFFIGSALEKTGVFNYTLSDSLKECGYYIYAQRWDGNRASRLLYSPNYFVNPKTTLPAPSNRSGSYNLKNVVNLKWTPSPDKSVLYYVLLARDAKGSDSVLSIIEPQLSEYSFSMDNPGLYQYSIQSYGASLSSGCPAPFTGVLLAVDDERGGLMGSEELVAYPNPSSQHMNIQFQTEATIEQTDIFIVNSLGQRVSEYHNTQLGAGAHTLRLDVSHLSSGPYFVYLNKSNRVLTTRFSVLR